MQTYKARETLDTYSFVLATCMMPV